MGDNNAIIAGILSFFIPGLGHALINKKMKKGIVMFVIAIVAGIVAVLTLGLLSILSLAWCLFSAYDAYMEAQGKPVWKLE